MSETKHSPEPWKGEHEPWRTRGDRQTFRHVVRAAGGRSVCAMDAMCEPVAVPDANMRRIVACVNACAGVPTEELEALKPGDIALALGVRALGQLNAVMRGEEP